MKTYEVRLTPAARRHLAAIPSSEREMVAAMLTALTENPRPTGCLKMTGPSQLWRVRVGRFRVLYRIDDGRLIVLVVKIGDRKDVYR